MTQGLAGYTAIGTGTLIAFATAPGQTALDGDGDNSPFTMALVKHLKTPGLEIRQMLTRVRADVVKETKPSRSRGTTLRCLGRSCWCVDGAT